MSYLTKTAQVFGRILAVVVGDGLANPSDAALKAYPHLRFYNS